jgi:glycosyltransferase involved in cell wall biosynthesis
MKILHVHKYYHARDGVGRYLFDLMRLSEEAGHTTAIFSMHEGRNEKSVWEEYFLPELETKSLGRGKKLVGQIARSLWSRDAEKRMEKMLKVFRPDVVHAHNLYTHMSPSVLEPCRKAGIPVVMTVHDYALVSANYALWTPDGIMDMDRTGILDTARSRFIKGSFLATFVQEMIVRLQRTFHLYDRAIERYVTLSQFVKDALIHAGYDKEKIDVIPPLAGPLGSGRDFSGPREKCSVLFAGRLEEYKGIQLYLELAKTNAEYTFYVAGTGPMESVVREAAAKHKNIIYLGFLSGDNLWKKMASVELFIAPSLWYEPYGLVALEALALGTPTLVSDRGGLPELARLSGGGKVFKAGDLSDLKKKFAILKDEDERAILSEKGKSYVAAHHSPQVFLARMVEEYERAEHSLRQ